MTKFEEQIRSYMDAVFPILYIHTSEVEKAKRAIRQATADIRAIDCLVWDGTDRVCDLCSGIIETYTKDMLGDAPQLKDVLDDRIYYDANRHIFILENIETFIKEPEIIARLKKFAEQIHVGNIDAAIFIISPTLQIAPELEKYITVMELDYPEEKEIRNIVQEFCSEQGIQLSKALLSEFASALKGLSEFEIEHILQLAYSSAGELHKSHISLIFDQKRQIIQKAGILEMVPLKESLEDIGGLENLKDWLYCKAKVLSHINQAKEFGVDTPKGVLIVGVPGCGKSLSAKAAAKLFNVPLLRLDMGRLLGKYLGESEENMRKAIKLAEVLSPCVLWIDELEKAFAGIESGSSGSEVATRLFGSFLTWTQEKESAAFVVATANDITKLPPEMMRKGRFDEIFYVELPNEKERRKIFEIHIKKRRPKDLPNIQLDNLAKKTEGYSGADIEGVVKESVEKVFVEDKNKLETEDILHAIEGTHSLLEIMKGQITKIMKTCEEQKLKKASKEGAG